MEVNGEAKFCEFEQWLHLEIQQIYKLTNVATQSAIQTRKLSATSTTSIGILAPLQSYKSRIPVPPISIASNVDDNIEFFALCVAAITAIPVIEKRKTIQR